MQKQVRSVDMERFKQNGPMNGEMVPLMNQSYFSLMNSLANKLASSSISLSPPANPSEKLLKKIIKKNNKNPFMTPDVDAAILKNVPMAIFRPATITFPFGSVASKIPRAKSKVYIRMKQKFGEIGSSKGQFYFPHGFCLGPEEEIVVVDSKNHRIQVYDRKGLFSYGFGTPGKSDGMLWYPRKIALNRVSNTFVISDRGPDRTRIQLFSRSGIFLHRIPTPCIEILAGLAVTQDGFIVAVDSVEPTVFILKPNGSLVHMFNCGRVMREPSEVAVRGSEIFVLDFKGHSVVVFSRVGDYLRRFGGPSLTNFPNGIDISSEGLVVVGDSHGNLFHMVVFNVHGDFLMECECPDVRVSRCCGLKITSEGSMVTAAKNNHHMIVTEPLMSGDRSATVKN